MDFTHRYDSPLGGITLACSEDALTGLWFSGQRYYGSSLSPEHTEKMTPVFEMADKWLDMYFAGMKPDLTPPLLFRGTDFQKKVWSALLTIPYGQTVTYGDLAKVLEETEGIRVSARAVGGAVGKNPLSLIVPCHRVIGADGSLTGYAGGIDRKEKLLAMERLYHGIL